MEAEKYKALINGEILPGVNPETAKQNLAQLFKTDLNKIESLFTGKPFLLKQGMTLEEAQRYRLAVEQTGTRCHIVKMPTPQSSQSRQPTAAAPKPQLTTPIYEVRYKAVFYGDILPGKKKDEVIINLAQFYKMEYQKVSQLFTGRGVEIKGATDYWTAVEFVKRFRECGAVCEIQSVEPTATSTPKPEAAPVNPAPTAASAAVAVAASPKTQAPEIPPAAAEPPAVEKTPAPSNEAEEIKSKSNDLYERLTKAFSYVKGEYDIEKKSKKVETQEGTMGCLFLLIIAGIIALVIWTTLRWYMGLLFGIGLVVLFSLFMKKWDLQYVDVFLSRMDRFKKQDPALFIVTLNKWVNDLPAQDRAKVHLQNLTAAAIRENPNLKPELDKYAEVIGPLIQTKDEELDELEELEELEKELEAEAAGDTVTRPKKPAKKERRILCPRCGSNFITEDTRGFSWGKGVAVTLFFGPLAGAVAGSSKQGEAIYVCGKCNKKWKR